MNPTRVESVVMTELDGPGHRSRHIALVGDMAVGKTTVGSRLATAMGRPFLDSDEMLERETGRMSAEIAAREGVAALHARELSVFVAMVASSTPSVLAPAASVVDFAEGRDLLRACTTVWLVATPEVVERRQGGESHRRSLGHAERIALERTRHPLMAEIADLRIDTSVEPPARTVERLRGELEDLT